ncbi:MAG: hypothetical protein ACNS62_24860 [Candidatus Cyclobacteriaceae bacterium M3_2C_046]
MFEKKLNRIFFVTLGLILVSTYQLWAQCAMCRATVENNVSNGDDLGIASSLNFGILYLFFTPYIVIAVIGYFWYKSSKSNAKKISIKRRFTS